MENQYLSDAKGRLTDPDLWGPSVQTEIRELALGTSPDIETKLEDLNCNLSQNHMSGYVWVFRFQFFNDALYPCGTVVLFC